ncbi:MAG: phosphate ABC transporter substrate-binding protein [Chloroflexi bacterium]|nr:MAG: phosphate ABC transporter substrate-binding protein [Chloroflexota bacterium]TMC29424.1 MAG: phosphate ABC transporter substrate-binding protein [Chloroflexota bacterium]TMC35859.1 MAG: phosphate ABC transporter substrate-binding protein [Chloroflexota bacterium]TMC57218.1 MAG: phosphate ABC transporter substrate-binding protein [Chloroflexota bacterium]
MNVALRSLALAFALALVGACGGSARPATPTADPLAGRYTATGGGGAIAAVNALAKRFSESHPGVVFQIDETGSDAGVNLATSGGVDFGFTSRALTASEATQLSAVGIGLAGTCVIVNAANPVKNLNKEQVRQIFAGDITNWKQVGGQDLQIKVFIREANAATRGSFESYFFGGKATYVKDATEVFELEQTLKAVGSFGASIGMATASSRTVSETTVNVLTIDGVAPSPENLVNGTYKVGRPLLIVVPSDAAKVKPAIKAFLDFVRSPEGQKLAASTY